MNTQLMEEQNLKKTAKFLNDKIAKMELDIFEDTEKIKEFRRYAWENKGGMDAQELNEVRSESEQEAILLLRQRDYFKKLLKIKSSPYFASIEIDDEKNERKRIYIGLTYLKQDNLENLIYDWRSPVCSIFYDYENGPCTYEAPSGFIKTNLYNKRQYKIENQELKRIIDSSINIDDDILQEVLAESSSDKMKNIVNTIQQEQNMVIRNTTEKNLIVQGIAGSGKTSVALHRIAFLLYKIKNLTSNKVLIFSPNNVFTEYISNVLPELGEENTLQTTFHDYLSRIIKEYKKVESYIDFLNRAYANNSYNAETLTYKQSDKIIDDLKSFVDNLEKDTHFKQGFIENKIYEYKKEELDYLFHTRYSSIPFFSRIEEMAIKFSENNYRGTKKKVATYRKLILEALGIKKDYKKILQEFFMSKYFQGNINKADTDYLSGNKLICYDDALILVYLKGLMEGFYVENLIEQVVIDEAQDYSYLQYLILNKIFKKASFTILGDVNQNINPYYRYDNLNKLLDIFPGKYIELNKTYRSSEEIIEFANSVLGLNHVCAIRKNQNKPVIKRNNIDNLINDINYLKNNYSSLAIITKNMEEAKNVYEKLKLHFSLSLIDVNTSEFNKNFVVLPVYLAKGLEFDSVIVYETYENHFEDNEKNLYYVAITRAQHELYVYNIR